MRKINTRNKIQILLALILTGTLLIPTNVYAAQPTGVVIRATMKASVKPNAIHYTMTLTNVSSDSKLALAATSTQADTLRQIISKIGGKSVEIQSNQVSIYPEIEYRSDGSFQQIGNRVVQRFKVTIRDLSIAGSIVDQSTAAIGSTISIDSGDLFNTDPERELDKLRVGAAQKAKRKALLYASNLGAKLGKVISITEIGNSSSVINPTPIYTERDVPTVSTGTQIDPGTNTLYVTVEVRWSLR